jgi:hypothetical protein
MLLTGSHPSGFTEEATGTKVFTVTGLNPRATDSANKRQRTEAALPWAAEASTARCQDAVLLYLPGEADLVAEASELGVDVVSVVDAASSVQRAQQTVDKYKVFGCSNAALVRMARMPQLGRPVLESRKVLKQLELGHVHELVMAASEQTK